MAYLYRHIRLDKNIPFYIGIGNDNNFKRAKDKKQRSNHWKSIVNKTDYEVDILMDGITWEFACEKETEFIKLYGRSDNNTGFLVNKTDGGEGRIGAVVSDDTRRKLSARGKGRKFSEESRKKMSVKQKGRPCSAETKKRMSQRLIGAKFPDERNKKISETLKRKYASGERVSALKGRLVSEESRKKMSVKATGRSPWNKGVKQKKATQLSAADV